jgi:phosphoglycolate phosphatase-like HAD superfamily hydrolase
MGSGGRASFYGKIVDGKFVKGKKGVVGVEKYVKTTDGRYFLEKSDEASPTSKITNWVARPGRLYYGVKDPAYIKLIELTKEYKGKKVKRVTIKKAFTKEAKEDSKINMDALDYVVNQLADAVANGMSLDIAATIIVQSYQATSGLIKIAAPILYRSDVMEYAGKGSKPEQRTGEKYREEHTIPASVVGASVMWAIKNNKAQPIMQAIRDNYYQTQLSKKDDFLLDMAKLDSTLPEGFTIFDNPAVRLAVADIDLNTITNPYTGKKMAESVAGASIPLDVYNSYNESQKLEAVSYQNEQIIKAISDPNYNPSQTIKAYLPLVKGKAMASKRNSDLIPDPIKYSKAITVKTSIDALSKADKALNNARKLNAPVKKIRVFDFDDTLARTNSRVIYTMPNFEGGFSPESVRQKAIFMVGGPGAGKTNIGKGLKLGRQGYKVVNQDIALEAMKSEAGLPAKEAEYTTEQISTRSKLGAAARKAAIAKFDKYAANGDGMVIDGTGASYPATMKKVKQLQDAGYEVHMVVANTSLKTALARNKARVERSLPNFIVKTSWDQVQESTKLYKKDFGDKLYEINTEEIGFGEDLPQDFLDKVYAGINSNIQGKLEAGTFAEQATDLEAQGAEWNFSEFSKIVDGKEGPLFKVAKIIADKRGAKDIFVLTARPADAAKPIQQFLKSLGLNIPIKNITGLGDGAAEAKARWIMDKASEGYNDFYFADDVTGNVKAVEEVLSQIDVKSKVQQAKASKRQDFDRVINDMIFDTAGIETYKKYSPAKAKTIGAGKGKYTFFIPSGAEDFTGLLYKMIGKGKKGDAQMAFLKQNLLDTYNKSEISVTQAKIAAMNDFIALKKQLKTLPKTLNKQTGIGKFNYSHAVRVFIWQNQGVEIPGLSKKDTQDLTSFVESDPKLKVFAEQLSTIQKDKPYPSPSDSWLAGTISSDIINDINTVKRAEYQQEFRENVDIIFSEENLNKMEAAYGTNWRAAIEDSIRRMKSGSNRPEGGDSTTRGILDWLNNSVGAVMFLNTRSALLQTISSVNFINWDDNNIFKAGLAFANQKQFWKDFITLMNSDYLVERRNGLKINISESEIADAAANSKNKANAVISYILNKGFVMTQFADSFAIASGGSTFYRNRIKSLVKSGMDPKLAEQRAFEDFRAIAEESQQSSNPVRISRQQASTAGRVILAWANTPMQYARIQKRAIQDLVNGRGNAKANVSKIIYYGIVQNLLFNTLQSAIDAIGFGDDDDDESKEELKNKRKEKAVKVANGMLDSQLRGLGIAGAAASSLKNFLLTLMEEDDKKRPEYQKAVDDLFAFSPPLGSKIQKISGGLRSFSWNKKEMKEKSWSLDNPAYLAGAQIFTGLTNVPVDRVVKKTNNMRGIFSELSARWQKIALVLGWSTYDVGLPYYGGFDAVEPLTPEEEAAEAVKLMMDQTNTAEQKQMLEELGLTKAEIKELKYEENRVNKIIELKNKPIEKIETKEEVKFTKEEVKPKEEVKTKKLTAEQRLQKQFDSIKAENKPDQVKTLTNFGLSKKEIRALKYEEDRVNKILELMSKKQ